MERVLITGGAGFIGSHLADALLRAGHEVMVFDNLTEQVHPLSPQWPDYTVDIDGEEQPWVEQAGLHPWFGDVRDGRAVHGALRDFRPDTVIHLAALVGVAQSNEQIARYTSANVTGTAVLLNAILDNNRGVAKREALELDLAAAQQPVPEDGESEEAFTARAAEIAAAEIEAQVMLDSLPDTRVRQVFIAGSMSSYGEGVYIDGEHFRPYRVPIHGAVPSSLHETDALMPASVYASNKAEQERLGLVVGQATGLDVRVARFFNVYGSRQALSNPYTGVGAIFASRVLSGLAPRVYEDGKQSRDFTHVSDIVSGIVAIMEHGKAGEVYNIGTGQPTSIYDLAKMISDELGGPDPEVTRIYRAGDIRHAYANVSKLRRLGWEPRVKIEDGVKLLCDWARKQDPEDRSSLERAHVELEDAGLLVHADAGGAS